MAFYTYWADVPARDGSPAGTGEIYGRPGCAVSAWPTNDGLLLTYLAWPAARFEEFRRDVEGNVLRTFDAVGLGERIRACCSAGQRFRGTPDLPSYLRQPYGPGWALVGDAGLLLDPITGHGISNAFRDAELLADAVADGFGGIRPLAEALARYHQARDRAARPMYDFTARLAAISPPRRPRARSSGRSRAASRTPTCSSARWPARSRCASSCRRAPWCASSACAGSPGWHSARRGRSGLGRTSRLRPADSRNLQGELQRTELAGRVEKLAGRAPLNN